MKIPKNVLWIIILLITITGCGSDSGKKMGTYDLFTDYGLKKEDIATIRILSSNLSNEWTGNPSTDSKKTMAIDLNTSSQLSVNAYDMTGKAYENIKVNWTSNDKNVVNVNNSTGEITGISPGETIVTATLTLPDGSVISDTITVVVMAPPNMERMWVNAGVNLPTPMWDHASTIWNGYLYVAGGNSSCDGNHQNCGFTKNVYYAPIHADGSLGAFSSATPMPRYLRGHSLLTYNNYMYIIGGIEQPQYKDPPFPDPLKFQTILNEKVYYTSINPDGSIGSWKETTPISLPELPIELQNKAGLFAHSAVAHNGYIYIMGGWNVELKKNVATVLTGPIMSDGTIMKWIHNPNSDLPYDLSKHASVVTTINGESYLYVIGGNSGSIGGTQVFHREIYYAKIAPDGILEEWKPSSNNLIKPLIDHASVIAGRYLFVLGGRNGDDTSGYTFYPDIKHYFINDNGELGPPSSYSPLPNALFHHSVAADNNTSNIYVTGGAVGDTSTEENRKNSVFYLSKTAP